jgi:DNA-binding protein YbaB
MRTKIDNDQTQQTELITRTTQLTVMPKGEATYSELSTTITIEDEAAGEFVTVEQHGHTDLGKIAINPEEWPMLRAAINRMVKECR